MSSGSLKTTTEYGIGLSVDDARMLDAECVEPACPCVQVGTVSDLECDVVQAGPALVEGPTGVGLMMVQADRHVRTGVHEDDGVTALLGTAVREHDRDAGQPEDPLLPLSARLHIGNGRREVMDASDSRHRGGLGHGKAPSSAPHPWCR
jgi:hypothetical protein